MFAEPPRISRPKLPAGQRTIVISDIHGNLPYFKALLEKIHFSDRDLLILDGDFLEKGPASLGTLRFIMELSKHGNVYPILGNCDEWQVVFRRGKNGDAHMQHYLRRRRYGLVYEMLCRMGVDPVWTENLSDIYPHMVKSFPEEWTFLATLPHAIETEHYIFVHAGLNGSVPLEENSSDELVSRDAFLREGQYFDKWVITGHWPVVLYHENIVCANPIIDEEHHAIAIDGGCVLKDDGQLNAFIIPDLSCTDASAFTYTAYDPFPTAEVLSDQQGSSSSYYIRWGDSEVQVLERREEFSRCRHVRTGYEMDILTKYLFQDTEITPCNDCTDYILPLKRGDTVSIVEETSRGAFVKHNGISGWYYGKLQKKGCAGYA
jgi:protein phosphatase